jgi:hypothetical protein
MFQSAGQHKVKITEACICTSPYDKSERDLAVGLHGESLIDPGQSDWWYGVLNEEYGVGNSADKKRWELTVENLQKIGWKHGKALNDGNLQSLVGVETEFGVKGREHNGKEYFDVKYIGPASFGPKRVDSKAVDARLKALFGGEAVSASAPVQKASPKAQKAAPAPIENAEVTEENIFGF